MRRILYFAVAVLSCAPAHAEGDWGQVAESTNGTLWLIRLSDFTNKTNFKPRVWFKLDHSKDRSKKEREKKEFISFDCMALTYQTLSVITYDAAGEVLHQKSMIENEYLYEPAPPDSVIEAAFKAACPSN